MKSTMIKTNRFDDHLMFEKLHNTQPFNGFSKIPVQPVNTPIFQHFPNIPGARPNIPNLGFHRG